MCRGQVGRQRRTVIDRKEEHARELSKTRHKPEEHRPSAASGRSVSIGSWAENACNGAPRRGAWHLAGCSLGVWLMRSARAWAWVLGDLGTGSRAEEESGRKRGGVRLAGRGPAGEKAGQLQTRRVWSDEAKRQKSKGWNKMAAPVEDRLRRGEKDDLAATSPTKSSHSTLPPAKY